MKNRQGMVLTVIAFVLAAGPGLTFGQPFDKSEYAARRNNLMAKIPDGAAIILGAQTIVEYNPFVQNNDMMYFAGVEIPNAALIVDGKNRESLLFFTLTERGARNEGISLDLVNKPQEATGIERVLPMEQFGATLSRMASQGMVLYTSFMPEELARECTSGKFGTLLTSMVTNPWDGRLTRERQFVKNLNERLTRTPVKDCSAMIWDLRMIKSPAEIEMLRKVGALGAKAALEVVRSCRPGISEYELSAIFEYTCRKAWGDIAYNVIISSDENHPYLHYYKHDRKLVDGDFLVVDAGPDLGYYDVDISFSFPANGKFTPRQREIYEAALAMNRECQALYRPGITAAEVREQAKANLEKKGFDMSKDIWKIRSMQGGVSHYVGMAVHDVGGSPSVGPLKRGMVFACDVYAVFPEEKLGVRVEDTVVITESGCENLTKGVPRGIAEIEALMKTPGLIQIQKEKGIY
jgi:Xaa-Pro aminopeptidase